MAKKWPDYIAEIKAREAGASKIELLQTTRTDIRRLVQRCEELEKVLVEISCLKHGYSANELARKILHAPVPEEK
jgi:hypothetical protein